MLKIVIVCGLVGWARAAGFAPAVGVVPTTGGVSTQTRSQDNLGNVAFSYEIQDPYGATNARGEQSDAYNNRIGYYSLTDIDGRIRRVDYVADGDGFRASVQTNEPGTLPAHTAGAAYSPVGAAAPIPAPLPEPAVVATPVSPGTKVLTQQPLPLSRVVSAPVAVSVPAPAYSAPFIRTHAASLTNAYSAPFAPLGLAPAQISVSHVPSLAAGHLHAAPHAPFAHAHAPIVQHAIPAAPARFAAPFASPLAAPFATPLAAVKSIPTFTSQFAAVKSAPLLTAAHQHFSAPLVHQGSHPVLLRQQRLVSAPLVPAPAVRFSQPFTFASATLGHAHAFGPGKYPPYALPHHSHLLGPHPLADISPAPLVNSHIHKPHLTGFLPAPPPHSLAIHHGHQPTPHTHIPNLHGPVHPLSSLGSHGHLHPESHKLIPSYLNSQTIPLPLAPTGPLVKAHYPIPGVSASGFAPYAPHVPHSLAHPASIGHPVPVPVPAHIHAHPAAPFSIPKSSSYHFQLGHAHSHSLNHHPYSAHAHLNQASHSHVAHPILAQSHSPFSLPPSHTHAHSSHYPHLVPPSTGFAQSLAAPYAAAASKKA